MKTRKRKGNNSSMRSGLKVRHYIFNILRKNTTSSVMIPSSPQLTKILGLSRSTITLELKKLVAEGVLVGRVGIGTFTNPTALPGFAGLCGKKIVGIIAGDGRNLFFENYTWALQSYIGLGMLPLIAYPRAITLSAGEPDRMFDEINSMNLDGLVWIAPKENPLIVANDLSLTGLPVVLFDDRLEGISSVEIDYYDCGLELARILLERNCRRTVWLLGDHNVTRQVVAAREVYREAGVPFDKSLVFESGLHWLKDLENLLRGGLEPDAVYAHGEKLFPLLELLEKYGIDTERKCLVIAEGHDAKAANGFRGLVHHLPFEEGGGQVARIMDGLMNCPDKKPEKVLVKQRFEFINLPEAVPLEGASNIVSLV